MRRNLPQSALDILKKRARCYVSTDADAARLAERVLQMLGEDPSVLDAPHVDEALLLLVHHVAQDTLKPDKLRG